MSLQVPHPLDTVTEDQGNKASGMEFGGMDARVFLAHMPLVAVESPQQMFQGAMTAQKIFHSVTDSPIAAAVGASNLLPNFGLFQQPTLNTVPTAPAPAPARKRRRETHLQARQQQQQQRRRQQQQQQQEQQLNALQLVDLNQAHGCGAPQSGIVSTGLRLAFDDEHSTVTSSRPETRSSAVKLLFNDEISTQLRQQQEELSQLIKLQAAQCRQLLEEQTQRHFKSLLLMIDEEASRQLHEKDLEIERMDKRNLELEERIKYLNLEAHMWQSKAKNHEAMVAVLRTNLQQAVVQSRERSRMEGCGDSEADDAASARIDENAGAQRAQSMMMTMKSREERLPIRCCKRCGSKEVSVLLVPCMHLSLCSDCKAEVEKCPICNSPATAQVEVYLS